VVLKDRYLKALVRIREDSSGVSIWRYMLSDIVYDLKEAFPKYSWVGIYLLDKNVLNLETYLGKPTEHTKIKISDGVCGVAVREGKSIIVNNVTENDKYIACDLNVKSEIVVPIIKDGEILGVIDIDSIKKDAFTDEDREFLEEVSSIISKTFPNVKKEDRFKR
jgi:GAF domain-containing protein